MEQNTINCGERTVQKEFRIGLRDICNKNNIVEHDVVEVFIKKKNK